MNIALVHYTAAPVIGGVERVMEEHANIFKEHGHRVTVLCRRGGGPDVVRLPDETSPDAQAAALVPLLAAQDVVFLHNVLTMAFQPVLTEALWRVMDELPRVRFIAWVHDIAACNEDYPFVAPLFSKAHPRCEYVAVSHLRARQFVSVAHLSADRCSVVPNGIDPARVLGLSENVAALAKELGLLDGRMLVLHPTRMVRRKNVEMSIAVGRALVQLGKPATVLITAAEDPHDANWIAIHESLRGMRAELEGVIFVGDFFPVGDEDLASLYRLADALLFPSRSEGFGLPVLEAALHRLPAFCSDIEPLREIAAERSMMISPDGDPGLLAVLIDATLAKSPEFRERRRVLREYRWDAIYEKHLAPILEQR